ncbi:MAG: dockerin type I repeat-containing protein, partial [Muribaculaceae bacterium]|nr:dockerin type I repeat-containing protein [Muribaculaceae bacterium]
PAWAEGETLTFEGTKLPCNAVDESGQGSYYVQHFFDWGYVDNRPDNSYGYYTDVTNAVLNDGFNLDWAVDDEGNPVELMQVDFVKVYCAELQDCGWLGETSTEVCGAIDLHPNAVAEPEVVPGDVNGDGECTGSDVTALYNFILYNDSSSIVNGDQNDDGDITGSDVTAVYNIILY